ncbi:uncharacterized protein Z520_00632 [Fonsecaea multimorphosa CBS 102226]|uniref:Uncharacterized protein n=1 Tax=Fonsecaea multimorphosa CBS 102226 TaxID=1442371 RepID=A0A0D2KKG7_9EURO|nr:uncharacterized protein Z520_00632 [Fonsecaea multimorphosa CBS 102226]KIY03940.1 hypothetical protein Z520_00632 [Fonsecaea multimorphosa CBS 102226]OAL31781.1 hypothetical protein AYO22_00651 [Fonsecaea multimorphosa]
MMMVPRAFAHNPLAQRQQHIDFNEKEKDRLSSRRQPRDTNPRPPALSALTQGLSQEPVDSPLRPSSDPVKIPLRTTERQTLITPRHPVTLHSQSPRYLTPPAASSQSQSLEIPRRKHSAQEILTSTTIPVRRKPKQRPSQRLPNCDYVADFSKLLRDDVPPSNDGSLSGSWTNPQFEGLFGNIDGLVEGQLIVGSESLDPGILSARSLSTESMPSLSSPDDFSSLSPATLRSPSDHRLRQMASSEDCSNQHPLLPKDEEEDFSGTSTPELIISPPARMRRRPIFPDKKQSSFKSSLTASLKALKSAAQTVSDMASNPPLMQSDEFLSRSVFEFRPSLTDDRRPPPSDEPPSAALRRYLNPNTFVPPDSPAQLHFWVDEKPVAPSSGLDTRPKLKIKKKYRSQRSASPSINEGAPFVASRSAVSQLPPVVQLATCIPSTIRTAHASSPPTWLEPDGTPSNKFRAAQTLWADPENGIEEGQPRLREPRENRDFLRVFVCELNMRKSGKLSEDAVGHAKAWLPPVDEAPKSKDQEADDVDGKKGGKGKRRRVDAKDRWRSWSIEDL